MTYQHKVHIDVFDCPLALWDALPVPVLHSKQYRWKTVVTASSEVTYFPMDEPTEKE